MRRQAAVDRIWGTNEQFSAPFKQSEYVPDEDDEKVAPTLSDEALLQLAKAKGTAKVATRTVTTTQKTRDPYIAEYAKRRAKGICQLCGNPAPFTDKQGNPYLESHHIVWLSKGGTDTIDNTVALCPNCHRKMHVMDDPVDVSKLTDVE